MSRVSSRRRTRTSSPPSTTRRTQPPPADDTVGLPPASEETIASVQQDVERLRSENCKKAQERYKTYIESQRLFRQTPNGGREYLSEAELAQARVRAKQAVDEFCN